VAGTGLMPRLVVGYAELNRSKLKRGNRFLKPNFELEPSDRGGMCGAAFRWPMSVGQAQRVLPSKVAGVVRISG